MEWTPGTVTFGQSEIQKFVMEEKETPDVHANSRLNKTIRDGGHLGLG